MMNLAAAIRFKIFVLGCSLRKSEYRDNPLRTTLQGIVSTSGWPIACTNPASASGQQERRESVDVASFPQARAL
jgi:hypothetical protein